LKKIQVFGGVNWGKGELPLVGVDLAAARVPRESVGALGNHALSGGVDGDEDGIHLHGGFQDGSGFTGKVGGR